MMSPAINHTWHRSLKDLLEGIVEVDVPECEIEFVTMDSRRVKQGTLFLATAGLQRHGLEFARQAWANGAVAILYEPGRGVVAPLTPRGKVCLSVDRLSFHLGVIAARFFDHPSQQMKVCGVTGTNGKTSLVHLVSKALRFVGQRCGQMGTLGYGLNEPLAQTGLTTPDAVAVQQNLAWLREQRATHMAMEVSSHALQQYRVNGVTFDCAVLTNLTRDHLDYHGDIESYAAAKQRLFENYSLSRAIINADDAFGHQLIDLVKEKIPVTAVGSEASIVDGVAHAIVATAVDTNPHGLRVAFSLFEDSNLCERGVIESPLLGKFNAQNILCALGVMLHWGTPLEQAVVSLANVKAPPGRMEAFGRKNNDVQIVVDYAHTPDALENAVTALREHCQGRLWCVFGCGGDRDRGKRPFMAQAANRADRIIVTNDNPRHEDPQQIVDDIVKGFDNATNVMIEFDREKAIHTAVNGAKPGDIVLIAGKGHEDYQVLGNQRIALSDRNIVAQLLKESGDV